MQLRHKFIRDVTAYIYDIYILYRSIDIIYIYIY